MATPRPTIFAFSCTGKQPSIAFHYSSLSDHCRLWGNPKHLEHLSSQLREKHSDDKLHILVAKTNVGNFTYDGIDLGGERVAQEVEDYIKALEQVGTQLKKISVVGYSLGGLIARYTIGLLYSRGYFDKLQPVNFTTFASPHLGVRTPFMGGHYSFWNLIGARPLSTSGRQLFLIDSFRDTNRPLLSVLSDQSSIFMTALSKFKNRVLYANITNDRSAPYYTTSNSTSDPFSNLDEMNLHYLPGYAPVILDPADPVSLKPTEAQPPFLTRILATSQALVAQAPLFALLGVLIPIGSCIFLVNAGIQSVRSQQRIKLHEQGKGGVGLGSYRVPLMIENARGAMEGAMENLGTRRLSLSNGSVLYQNGHSEKKPSSGNGSEDPKRYQGGLDQISIPPTLNLTEEQFAIVDTMDKVGFKKFRVHISKVRHTHAAIIVRMKRNAFEEGKVVVRHWVDEEFEI